MLLLVCIIAISFGAKTMVSNASAGSVTGYQKITWGISCGRYYVNGTHAFCAEYSKSWPTVGTEIVSITLCENDVIRKALYYGYNGPANTLGTDERAHVLTAIAISDANIGERETGASSKYDEFYWDITGKTIKNVIGSANALVILPKNKTFLAQNAIASTHNGFDYERVTINSLDKNSLGFADTEALGVGEDIHLLIALDKSTLLPPTLTQKYFWFIQDFGAELFAILAFLAIFFGYKISFKQIHKNIDKTKATIKKSPSIWRMLNKNVFDNHSLGSEILNLYAKNILDIAQKDDVVTLIKKTDNLKKLNKTEIKLLSHLFPTTETTLNSTKESSLKLKRAYNYLKQSTIKDILWYKLKLNKFYLIFSFLMLTLGILSASMLSINPYHTFGVVFISTLISTPLVILLIKTFKNRTLNILVKLFSFILIIITASLVSIYTSTPYSAIIIFTIYIIFYYNKLFSRRSGLMRSKIKETEDYKTYLQKNTELTVEARDFVSKIPYIYAFDIESKYPQTPIFTQITQLMKAKG